MNIGLVLSGGMAKGAYQIGALRALNHFLPREHIKYISCASVGVLNGYAYATGKLDLAEDLWRGICDDGARLFIGQMLKSSLLQKSITDIYSSEDVLTPTFYCSLLDLQHKSLIYKNLKSVDGAKRPLYLKASVAMPVYNRAVKIGEHSYFDGAMVDNIPVFPLARHRPDYIICIYFDETRYRFESIEFDKRIIKITFPAKSLWRQSVIFKQQSIREMIDVGYDRTAYLLSSVFYKGYDRLDGILQAISHADQGCGNHKLRITGDVLVSNLNKITKRLTGRRIL